MRHVVQLVLAVLAAAGAVVSWMQVRSIVDVAPVTDGQPATTSVLYDPPLMVLTMVLATAAGVLLVLGVAGLVRARRRRA
ncbi:cytochrome c-type biogenesis protein CcmH [Mycobacterium sp. DL592]|uniref:cytochrome c-type biogenesis protein CcmH n=1 Tax=Mycobacterium sp. DL592 TaxID=2675524 RepID=UPI00142369D7